MTRSRVPAALLLAALAAGCGGGGKTDPPSTDPADQAKAQQEMKQAADAERAANKKLPKDDN